MAGPDRTHCGPIVEFRAVRKEFPGVVAVRDATVAIQPGAIHVFAGENGAGKSTLMKLLAQVDKPSGGAILLDGEPMAFHGPRHARELGIAMVHQETALAPHLSVAANLTLGREPGRFGLVNRADERRRAVGLLARFGLELAPSTRVGRLPVAVQQLIEVAKAVDVGARVLIMDEPTASLAGREVDELFRVIADLKRDGMAICYISHRLDEIGVLADTVTVMRDGEIVATRPSAELGHDELVRLMVGRDIANLYPKPAVAIGAERLRVAGLSSPGVLDDVSFSVRAGEIVGLSGLVGAGRTELAKAVFGADPAARGRIFVDGREVRVRRPQEAIAAGIGYVTEDRKREGLALQLGIDKNITLTALPARGGIVNLGAERRIAERRRSQLNIKTPSVRHAVRTLSGGNQQKVVVAKWLEAQARVLFFDEPARGVDVGAKSEMFEVIGEFASAGNAVVLISSYLPELLNMCDRILVLRAGRIVGEVPRAEFSEQRVVAMATSGATAAKAREGEVA